MDIQYNSKCYSFEEKNYTTGLFDKSIDATYIIHLTNNGRKEHIEKQLSEFHPTKIVYIANNQGFKKCDKKLIEKVSYQDLTDAFLQCFQHANKMDYQNVLILEDDFIFSREIKESQHLNTINSFLSSKKEEELVYYLGCVPIIIVPYDLSHYSSLKSLTTHSVVYSKKAREKSLNFEAKHWDVILENNYTSKFLYYKPLCYQVFPETENKQNWAEKDNFIMSWLKDFFINLLGLQTNAEFGFSVIYFLAKFIFFIILLILVFILYKLVRLQKIIKFPKNFYKTI